MDLTTYALTKKIAESAVSGVESMSVDGTTLNIKTKDGNELKMVFPTPKDGIDGKDGEPGSNGISIVNVEITEEGHLECTLSNGEVIDAGIVSVNNTPVIEGNDSLDGKRILCIGDSICQGVGALEKPYSYWIREWHPDATVINLGVGGMTISQKDDTITNSLPVRIANGEFENSDYADIDIVVFEGGINDLMNNVRLGYISKDYAPTKFRTFCQGMEYMFNYFKNLYPNARMIFMSTHNVTAYDYNKNQGWWNAASEICAKWGVEFLDIFSLVCTSKIEGLQLHPDYIVHRDYYAKYLNMALMANAPLAGSRTSLYYKHNVPLMLTFYSGTKTFGVGSNISTSDWRMNLIRGDLTTYENVSSKVTCDVSDVDNDVLGSYPVHVAYTEDGITLSTDVYVEIIETASGDDDGEGENGDSGNDTGDAQEWDDTATITAAWRTNDGAFNNTTLTKTYQADTTCNVSCELMVESDTATSGEIILRVAGTTENLGSIKFGEVITVDAQLVANQGWLSGQAVNAYTTAGSGFPWTVHIRNFTITEV